MRFLFIEQSALWPVNSGHKQLMASFIEGLSEMGHTVDLFILDRVFNEPQKAKEWEKFGGKIFYHSLQMDYGKVPAFLLKWGNRLFGDEHFLVETASLERYKKALNLVCKAENYDTVFCNFVYNFPLISAVPSTIKTLLMEYNHQSQIEIDLANKLQLSPIMRVFYRNQAERLKQYERKAHQEAKRVLYISKEDQKVFIGVDQSSDVFYPPMKPATLRKTDFSFKNALLYSSDLSRNVNRDSLMWFLAQVWEELKAKFPQLTLYVTGNAPESLKSWAKGYHGVEFTGFLSEVKLEELAVNCDAFIAPIFSGSGIKIKILWAMSLGLPVVTTPKGAEGIEIVPGKDFELADNPNLFYKKLRNLLEDDHLRKKYAESGKSIIEMKYSEVKSLKYFLEISA
ncbi:MAG: glycosyltransferase family 4 protein [Chloroherpetonaceae bacterium]|nr:glycosyltransferase family 4 protein [Chloroherpetonaceae bacterium]